MYASRPPYIHTKKHSHIRTYMHTYLHAFTFPHRESSPPFSSYLLATFRLLLHRPKRRKRLWMQVQAGGAATRARAAAVAAPAMRRQMRTQTPRATARRIAAAIGRYKCGLSIKGHRVCYCRNPTPRMVRTYVPCVCVSYLCTRWGNPISACTSVAITHALLLRYMYINMRINMRISICVSICVYSCAYPLCPSIR